MLIFTVHYVTIVLVVMPNFFLLIVMAIIQQLTYLVDSFFRQVMEMAYSIAKERRDQGLLEMPLTWEQNESAGEDWYYGFMLRHSDQLS